MRIGFIGLGKMGLNMVARLRNHGHEIVGTARSNDKRDALTKVGGEWADSLAQLVSMLPSPRVIWVMVPAGSATEVTLHALTEAVEAGDIVVDGGNSDFRRTNLIAPEFSGRGIHFLDCGTSGGIWGLEKGYCLMIGGPKSAVDHLQPIFSALAPPDGWAHVGGTGAGHYVKMVHNAIEYGMMQAYAEGFDLLNSSGLALDPAQISRLWQNGSVIRSWLLDLGISVFSENPDLAGIEGFVNDSGEGRWAVETALAQEVAAPVIAAAVFSRFSSRQKNNFGHRYLAALRNRFGGHAMKLKDDRLQDGQLKDGQK